MLAIARGRVADRIRVGIESPIEDRIGVGVRQWLTQFKQVAGGSYEIMHYNLQAIGWMGDAPCGMGMFVSAPFPPAPRRGTLAPSLFCIIVGNNQRVFFRPIELDLLSRLRFVMACLATDSVPPKSVPIQPDTHHTHSGI